MKKVDIVCWVLVVLLLVFLWHSPSLEFFQDQLTDASGNKTMGPIRGAPYTASDAAKIVGMMPDSMKTSLQTSTGSTEPAKVIQPITDLMSDFHGSVYLPATVALKSSDVDTFVRTARIPPGLTDADVNTLLVAYFVRQQHGDANLDLTTAQTAANAQQQANAAHTSSNVNDYNALLSAVGQANAALDTSGTPLPPAKPTDTSGSPVPPTPKYSSLGMPYDSNVANYGDSQSPMTGMQVGGPMYGGQGKLSSVGGNSTWSSVGSNYPTLYGPRPVKTNLPNSNSSGVALTLPTVAQVGADSNTVYMPGSRAPSQLGGFTPMAPQKTNGDPSGFLPDYRVFMK